MTAHKVCDGDRYDRRLSGAVLSESDDPEKPGIEIEEVKGGSSAQRNGLREGDLIVAANRRVVQDIDSFKAVIDEDKPLLLKILRGRSAMFLVLR